MNWVTVTQDLYCVTCKDITNFRRYLGFKGIVFCSICDEEQLDKLDGQ